MSADISGQIDSTPLAPTSNSSSGNQLFFIGNGNFPGAQTPYARTGSARKGIRPGGEEEFTRDPQAQGQQMTVAQAQMLWFDWSQADRLKWAREAYTKGYITNPLDLSQAQQNWLWAVSQSAGFFNGVRKQKVTPWEVLDLNVGQNAAELKKRAMTNKDGSITYSNTSVNLSNRTHVEALATSVLQQALGRDPTQAEINTFFGTLRGAEKANPTTTSNTVDGTTGRPISSTSVGGLTDTDEQQMIMDRLKRDPEYGKYQAATTYFNAAMQANAAIGGA